LTKSRRRKFRNILNAYVDSGRAVLRIANDQQSFEKLYLTLVDHHQRRRAFLGDEGCHASRSFSGFLRDVTESFWASDGALLACVDVDGKAAGCSLGFVSRGIHYIYQTGMDPQQQEHQTGWLLNLLHIEYAMRNRIEAIDFMRGDEPYKARFGSEQILGRDYRIVPNKPLAQLRHKVWLAKKSIKEVARGSLAVR
jgi:CelD/BcsL family acetyltransferase involved in cellulose biosynthesis